MTRSAFSKSDSRLMATSVVTNAPDMTPEQLDAECRYLYEERIAILRDDGTEVACRGKPTPEQMHIAAMQVIEFRKRFAKPEQQQLI